MHDNILDKVKAGDFLAAMKLNEIVEEKHQKKDIRRIVLTVIAVLGVIALIGAVVYAIISYFRPDYVDGYEDDIDDYEEDFFEDEVDEPAADAVEEK